MASRAAAAWALWKNPENLTERQREQLGWIAKTNPTLHRAWALKEDESIAKIAKSFGISESCL